MCSHILYSFRRCPFAMRARWVLLMSGEAVRLREVNLNNKPEELSFLSPKATVPVLVTGSKQVLDESIDIMKWVLTKSDPNDYLRAKDKDAVLLINKLIKQNDVSFKYHLDRFKYSSRFPGEDPNEHRHEARNILLDWCSRISKNLKSDKNGWLLSESASLADLAIWPFVRQYKLAEKGDFEKDNQLSPLNEWLDFFLNHKLFSQLMFKYDMWRPGQREIYFPQHNQFIPIKHE